MASSGLLPSFLGALQASLSVVLTITYGVIAAQFSLLSESSAKDISKLCVRMFLPALLITNVGSELHFDTILRYVPILIWSLIYTFLSMAIGFVATRFLRMPNWVVPALCFNNTTSLPLLLVQSLDATGILKGLVMGEDDTTSKAVSRAKSYFLVCAMVGNSLTFALGPKLLNGQEEDAPDGERDDDASKDLASDEDGPAGQNGDLEQGQDDQGTEEDAHEETSLLPDSVVHTEDDVGNYAHRKGSKIWNRLSTRIQATLDFMYAFLNAPLIGAAIGAVIGLVPPLHKAFFVSPEKGGFFQAWLTASIKNIGELFAALQIVVVGVKLSNSLRKMKNGEDSGAVPWGAMVFVTFIRFILWPVISIATIWGVASKTNWLDDDPMLWFALMLMPTGPPALKLTALADVNGSGEQEKLRIAKFLTSHFKPLKMAGIKRKSVSESTKPVSNGKAKKPKVDVAPPKSSKSAAKKQTKVAKAVPQQVPDDSPETASSESEDVFDGLSDDSRDSMDEADSDLEDGGVSVEKSSTSHAPKSGGKSGDANGALNSTNSKEAHAKQKVLAQERKAAKPNADAIQRTKKIWERLRRKSHVPRDERKELVTELFEIITGRVKDFVLKHDSVRVIQTALKYGNLEQRKMIATELKGEYKGLAESRYAKFLIGKLLVHGDAEIRDLIVPEFYGNVRRMIKHPEASWILDDTYRGIASPSQKAIILREWYGPEFALFRTQGPDSNPTSDLSEILAANPEKRGPIMRSLYELINQLVQKKTAGFTLLHDAMLQYFLNTKPGSEEATEFIELLKSDDEGDLLKNLAFTKSGARVVCLGLAYSGAKDRKLILKTYKDLISDLAFDVHGHAILLAAYDVIDDTVLVSKSIFPDLLGGKDGAEKQDAHIVSLANDLNARIPLLYLFAGPTAKWLLPADDLTLLQSLHAIRASTSKKESATRRAELLRSLSPPVLAAISSHAAALMQTSFGCQLITEAALSAPGAEVDKTPALTAVADAAASSGSSSDPVSPASARMLKTLVLGGRFNPASKSIEPVSPPLRFADLLYARIQPDLVRWATGAGSFVVLGLVESPDFAATDEVRAALRTHRDALERAARQETSEQKARREKEAADEAEAEDENGGTSKAGGQALPKKEKKKGTKAKKDGPVREVGNKGSKLLLEKLA
ncbi:MAG: hypothetical protein M1819_000185 [Sarea resinae]|nr:MAG: hypothetical protein M1819_000185 [Sarea resinae]